MKQLAEGPGNEAESTVTFGHVDIYFVSDATKGRARLQSCRMGTVGMGFSLCGFFWVYCGTAESLTVPHATYAVNCDGCGASPNIAFDRPCSICGSHDFRDGSRPPTGCSKQSRDCPSGDSHCDTDHRPDTYGVHRQWLRPVLKMPGQQQGTEIPGSTIHSVMPPCFLRRDFCCMTRPQSCLHGSRPKKGKNIIR
jgi:hypothetical protein